MDTAEFLDPDIEAHDLFEATDDDIYEAMMEAKGVWDGSLDVDKDDESAGMAPKLIPTRSEALQAVLTLRKYVRVIDEPYAHKLGSMLGSFRWRTRAMETEGKKDSKITDYFSRK
ncbi:hypothetical protein PISMIDRAFT_101632 [Pisolithus microcarpus 441]|uniref:Uncharacterized protein n=1 Tax=Pisolithus microcarpus 441 TaxID=765257 RepID=A0A0C9ZA53_9AGAM|nr:hypothetical protein BKA83DRAFT_101632 [Pisolithus microcarpus]KIK22859.1 hypothetical protein PISMIDRAFT_101632 [Pisolithus microcarpus 441]